MKGTEDIRQIERYIALDIHKEYVLAGGQNAKQEWVEGCLYTKKYKQKAVRI